MARGSIPPGGSKIKVKKHHGRLISSNHHNSLLDCNNKRRYSNFSKKLDFSNHYANFPNSDLVYLGFCRSVSK